MAAFMALLPTPMDLRLCVCGWGGVHVSKRAFGGWVEGANLVSVQTHHSLAHPQPAHGGHQNTSSHEWHKQGGDQEAHCSLAGAKSTQRATAVGSSPDATPDAALAAAEQGDAEHEGTGEGKGEHCWRCVQARGLDEEERRGCVCVKGKEGEHFCGRGGGGRGRGVTTRGLVWFGVSTFVALSRDRTKKLNDEQQHSEPKISSSSVTVHKVASLAAMSLCVQSDLVDVGPLQT